MAGESSTSRTGKKNDNENELLLYQYYPSYYCQKVVFALYEKRLKFKSHIIDLSKGEQFEPWFLKLNPKCEVPVLKDGVKVIPDSRRIIDYVEDNFSNGNTPRLFPEKGTPQYQTTERMRDLLDNIPNGLLTFGCIMHPDLTGKIQMPAEEIESRQAFFANQLNNLREYCEKHKDFQDHYLVKISSSEKFFAMVNNKDEVEKGILDVKYALKEAEKHLASQEKGKKNWLCGEKFTVADISLCILLSRLDKIGLFERYFTGDNFKHIQDYFKRAQQRDAYRKTMNQNSNILRRVSAMDTKDQLFLTIGSIAVIVGAVSIATFLIHRNK